MEPELIFDEIVGSQDDLGFLRYAYRFRSFSAMARDVCTKAVRSYGWAGSCAIFERLLKRALREQHDEMYDYVLTENAAIRAGRVFPDARALRALEDTKAAAEHLQRLLRSA